MNDIQHQVIPELKAAMGMKPTSIEIGHVNSA